MILFGCAAAPAAAHSPSPAPVSSASPDPAPVPTPSTPAPELELRFRKRDPVGCNARQTNTPCVFKRGAGCLLRTSNCEGKPCEELPPAPIDCDRVVPSFVKGRRACLDIVGYEPRTSIRIFDGDSSSEGGYGPTPTERTRMCSDEVDRAWRIDGVRGVLDWTKDACFTLDAKTRTLKAGCEPFSGTVIEGRL